MKRALLAVLLFAYRAVVHAGVLEHPRGRRVFLWIYARYKALFEAREVARLAALIAPGAVVFDVGANVGFFTLQFAQWVGEGGRVVALEPEPRNFAHLEDALARAGLAARVATVAAAVSDRPGAVALELNPFHPGDHKLGLEGATAGTVTVAATTLDDEVRAHALERVDFIKIDVQGAEPLVIGGALETLARFRPTLYVEIDDQHLRRFGSSARALIAWLCELGYQVHALAPGGMRPAMSLDEACAWVRGHGYADLLFLASGATRP